MQARSDLSLRRSSASARPSRLAALALTGVLTVLLCGAPPAVSAAVATTYHVAMTGSDAFPGTEALPFATVQKAVDVVQPGDRILVHVGTYSGAVVIKHSGTPSARITLGPAGDGAVTLTATFAPPPCDSTAPTHERTIQILGGADNWTIQGFNVVNGIFIFGLNADLAQHWQRVRVQSKNWSDRRSLPGRGVNDRVAARGLIAELSRRIGQPVDPSDGLRILNNNVTGRGIHIAVARYGQLIGNTVGNVDCGIGAGIWLNTFSDGWILRGNYVHDVAASTYRHYMQEGIRLGSASNYNLVERNLVTDLPGDGRGITTDVDPSWNTIQYNTARRTQIGFNDEMSGWGNTWQNNLAEDVRAVGFNFRALDADFTSPSLNSSTYRALVRCNRSVRTSAAMYAGTMKESTFINNYFARVVIASNLRNYWTAEGNRWNGSTSPPSSHPPLPAASACP